ncbi:MAG: DUF3194 domain-containing protein [Thermoproteota archaeon]|nr:DUF3194 domain-containing protein [Thermoproteota archaeon]
MEEIGIPKLSLEQIATLCEIAERAARIYILSKVPSRRISTLNITVETGGAKPVSVTMDVEVTLSPLMKNYDVEKLVSKAKEKAFSSVKKHLEKLACKSKK